MPDDKLYEIEVEITARGSVKAKVFADSAEQAEKTIERLGVNGIECDWDEFLNLADFDVDVEGDPVEVVPEPETSEPDETLPITGTHPTDESEEKRED